MPSSLQKKTTLAIAKEVGHGPVETGNLAREHTRGLFHASAVQNLLFGQCMSDFFCNTWHKTEGPVKPEEAVQVLGRLQLQW